MTLWVNRLALLLAITTTTGCAIKPWVKPYERNNLADPIMAFDRDPVSSRYMNHVYDAREAARGADGSAGGGCGCN
jgi:DNA primase